MEEDIPATDMVQARRFYENLLPWLEAVEAQPDFELRPDHNVRELAPDPVELATRQRQHEARLERLNERLQLAAIHGTPEAEEHQMRVVLERVKVEEQRLSSELDLLRTKAVEVWALREAEEDEEKDWLATLDRVERALRTLTSDLPKWRESAKWSELRCHDLNLAWEKLSREISESEGINRILEKSIRKAENCQERQVDIMSRFEARRRHELRLEVALQNLEIKADESSLHLWIEEKEHLCQLKASRIEELKDEIASLSDSDQFYETLAQNSNGILERCRNLTPVKSCPQSDASTQMG